MTALPFEVLVIVFKDLEFQDLKQCQLVNKLWNQASVKQVYSVITINTEEKSRLYVRTIKSLPHLGKYLKTIATGGLFQKKKKNIVWDKHGLLDTIINYCPDLLNIDHRITYSPFWTKLMYAASQGQLSRLQNISGPRGLEYDYYVYTALSFKATLNTLNLPDFDYDVPDFLESEAYPMLRDNLNQFPCLQNLLVSFRSVKPLSHYDRLIDDCKHLKKLSILTSENYEDILGTVLPKINPRPDILEFECSWVYIKEDNQMNYVMQKFPNLQLLSVRCQNFDCEYLERDSQDILIQFLDFVTNIKEVNLKMVLDEEECLKVWADVINEKYKKMELKISLLHPREFEEVLLSVNFIKPRHLHLQFMPTLDFVWSYTQFLADVGGNIQRLILKFFCNGETYESGILYTVQNIISAIELCPSLQHLELEYVHDLPIQDCITYRHYEVKSLKLLPAIYVNTIETYKNVSLIFPNLKELELSNYLMNYRKSMNATIVMTNTSLDIFKWTFVSLADKNDKNFKVYIRLNVKSGERFYELSGNELSSIDSNDYKRKRSVNNFYLNITCQNLGKLQINNFTCTF